MRVERLFKTLHLFINCSSAGASAFNVLRFSSQTFGCPAGVIIYGDQYPSSLATISFGESIQNSLYSIRLYLSPSICSTNPDCMILFDTELMLPSLFRLTTHSPVTTLRGGKTVCNLPMMSKYSHSISAFVLTAKSVSSLKPFIRCISNTACDQCSRSTASLLHPLNSLCNLL